MAVQLEFQGKGDTPYTRKYELQGLLRMLPIPMDYAIPKELPVDFCRVREHHPNRPPKNEPPVSMLLDEVLYEKPFTSDDVLSSIRSSLRPDGLIDWSLVHDRLGGPGRIEDSQAGDSGLARQPERTLDALSRAQTDQASLATKNTHARAETLQHIIQVGLSLTMTQAMKEGVQESESGPVALAPDCSRPSLRSAAAVRAPQHAKIHSCSPPPPFS